MKDVLQYIIPIVLILLFVVLSVFVSKKFPKTKETLKRVLDNKTIIEALLSLTNIDDLLPKHKREGLYAVIGGVIEFIEKAEDTNLTVDELQAYILLLMDEVLGDIDNKYQVAYIIAEVANKFEDEYLKYNGE